MVVGMIGVLFAVGSGPSDGDGGEDAAPATTEVDTTFRGRRRQRPPTTIDLAPPTAVSAPTFPAPLLGEAEDLWATTYARSNFNVVNLDTGAAFTLASSTSSNRSAVARAGGVVVVQTFVARFYARPFDHPALGLGPADWVLPAGPPDQVWLGTDRSQTTVQLRSVRGELVAGPVELPEGATPVAGVDEGLLVAASGDVYLLAVPTLIFERVAEGSVLAASGSNVLHYGCDEALQCGARLTDLRDGRTRPLPVPKRFRARSWSTAAFSPLGERLAILVDGIPIGEVDPPAMLAIVDLDAGTATAVDGTDVGSPPSLAINYLWSPDGDWVFWCEHGVRAVRASAGLPLDLTSFLPSCEENFVVL